MVDSKQKMVQMKFVCRCLGEVDCRGDGVVSKWVEGKEGRRTRESVYCWKETVKLG